jgi:SAM-dependent methyltransferase
MRAEQNLVSISRRATMVTLCNICQNDHFRPRPNGRLSRTGLPPECTRCRSLERHRAFRLIFEKLRDSSFEAAKCLQISLDLSLNQSWFHSVEVSVYGTGTGIDIQRIERPDKSYDFIVCNHVLEHVPDYRGAICELVRIARPDGFLFLSFPCPYSRKTTDDWGYARADQNGHYRMFGRDVEAVYSEIVPQVHVVAVQANDPVTGAADLGYILTRSDIWCTRILSSGVTARVCQVRRDASLVQA